MKKLTIVIPAYNEEKNLKKGCLDQVKNYLDQKDFDYEVIIVDDGSSDTTKEIVKTYVLKTQ